MFLLVTFSAFTQQKQISIQDFVEKPLGFKPSIDGFKNYDHPEFKLHKSYFKNHPSDSIYKFYKGKNAFFLSKTRQGEYFFAGIVTSRKIIFNGNIHIGMTKEAFAESFTDEINTNKDTLEFRDISYPVNYTFFFKRNKLKKIKIDNKKSKP